MRRAGAKTPATSASETAEVSLWIRGRLLSIELMVGLRYVCGSSNELNCGCLSISFRVSGCLAHGGLVAHYARVRRISHSGPTDDCSSLHSSSIHEGSIPTQQSRLLKKYPEGLG